MIDYQTYQTGEENDVLVIVVSGRLDNATCDFFFDCVEGHIDDGQTKIILDCGGVDYISSMGLGVLVRAHSRMKKKGGNVKIAALRSIVATVISQVGLDSIFQLYPSAEEAAASF